MKYIDVEKLKERINYQIECFEKELKSFSEEDYVCSIAARFSVMKASLNEVQNIIDSLQQEQSELDLEKDEPVSNDLEEFAKRESEMFGEREYEIDHIDRNALAKGYYWGVKAGVQWQKERDQSIIELAEDHAYFASSENTREKLIDKACEWLKKNRKNYSSNALGEEYLIDDFKKAMKGE